MEEEYFKGRGAQIKTNNKFLKERYVTDHPEGLDEPLFSSPTTQIFYETPQKVVNKVTSPDLGMMYSINPYQGCEHGCIYCYARNTHEGMLGLGAVVAIHEIAEIGVIANALRARRGIDPRAKVEQPGATVDRNLGVLTRA